MAIDVPGDIVRVTIASTYADGQVCENNVCYRCSASGGTDTRPALGSYVLAAFAANWIPLMPTNSALYGYKVANVNKVPPPIPAFLVNIIAGSNVAIGTPTQARPLLKMKTAFAGQKYRGRLFLPPVVQNLVSAAGFPTAGLNTATTALGAALAGPFLSAGSTWILGIAHMVKQAPLATTITDVTVIGAAGLFGTQWKSGNTGRQNANPW